MPVNALSASPVQVIAKDELQLTGATDVGQALKYMAGIQVKDYGGVGGMKTVDARGLGSQHTGVVYDGVQVGDCQTGQVDLGRFTLGNIQSIYLTIGQDDDIYQSAKTAASAAVVHINTQAFMQDKGLSASLLTGSYGLAGASLLGSKTWGRWHLSAFADYRRADGNYHFKLKNGLQTISQKRDNSDLQDWRGELNAAYSISSKQTIRLKLYGYDSHRGLPGAVIYDNPLANERLADKNVFAQMAYENVMSDHLKLKAAMKWNYSWMRDNDNQAGTPTMNRYMQNEVYATTTLWARLCEGLSGAVAHDFQYNYLSMTLPSCPYPTRYSHWTTAALRYAHGFLTATATLLATHIRESVKLGEPSGGFNRLSPAFSLALDCGRGVRIRAGYKDIFRTPTLSDLYYTGVGRRSLRPEKNRQMNVGVTYQAHDRHSRSTLQATLDGYYGNITDKIVAVPRMFLWQMMNVGKARQWGVDATLRGMATLAHGYSVRLTAAYSYMNITDRTNKSDVYYADQIAYTPRHSGNAGITLATPWGDMSYHLIAVARRYSLGYNIPANRVAGYADHSVTLSRPWQLGKVRLTTKLDVMNIGGRNYEVVRYYPMAGCNWRLGITLDM